MAASAFNINVRKIGREHVLFNHEAPAGPRLFRGGKGKAQWPFKDDSWMRHTSKTDADTAAKKLQAYLLLRDKDLNREHYK